MTLFGSTGAPRRTATTWIVNAVWAGAYLFSLITVLVPATPVWVWALCAAGLVAWLTRALLPDRLGAAQIASEAVMLVAGGLVAFAANVVGGIPLAVGLVLLVGRLQRPPWMGIAAVPVALATLGAGALLAPPAPGRALGLLLGGLAMVAISGLIGLSRRQSRAAELRDAQLLEERRRAERLADHARVARELHDVLAHGLGGLVVQLEAVDALLESGSTADAARRVRDARALAVEGLHDARRAVDALRSDDSAAPDVQPEALRAALGELVAAHEALGGAADVELALPPRAVPAATAAALRRTLQESLSNARKHAGGEPVRVRLRVDDGRLVLEVENPLGEPTALSPTGGGHGIAGMEERLAELDGGSLRAGARAGRFEVRAEVPA